jgi:hypothetical protein
VKFYLKRPLTNEKRLLVWLYLSHSALYQTWKYANFDNCVETANTPELAALDHSTRIGISPIRQKSTSNVSRPFRSTLLQLHRLQIHAFSFGKTNASILSQCLSTNQRDRHLSSRRSSFKFGKTFSGCLITKPLDYRIRHTYETAFSLGHQCYEP